MLVGREDDDLVPPRTGMSSARGGNHHFVENTKQPELVMPRAGGWRGRLDRTAVAVIDMQYAFFEDPHLEPRRDQLVTHGNEIVAWARSLDLPIIDVHTEHQRDGSTWTLNMLEDDQGYLFEGDDHTATLEELDLAGAIEVVKTRDDAFIGTDLGQVVEELGLEVLLLAGVSTHTCIAATAAHAFAEQLEVVLIRDAIASNRPELHDLVLDTLRDEYRCPVLDTEHLSRVTAE